MLENKSMSDLQVYASNYLVGGVSSNARINPYTHIPMYLSKARGAYLWDHTGKKYIDYFMGHGACLLGHGHPSVTQAIKENLSKGWTAEFDSVANILLAKKLTEIIPCAEQIRFTSSGTEGTALCMRIARAHTAKDKIIRIDGHFHGTNDYGLTNWLAGDIDSTNNGTRVSKINYVSKGIPRALAQTMIVIPWNNIEILKKVIQKEKNSIAGIIMVPMDFNNGCIFTNKQYLKEVNQVAHANNIVVIYDEILSCFRTGISCAQGYYGVTPDLCTLGKILSNGVPLSVVAGKKSIMKKIMDPLPIASGGTYSGNFLGVLAALATLETLAEKNFYPSLFETVKYFCEGMKSLFKSKAITAQVPYLGSNFFIYFGAKEPLRDYKQFNTIDKKYAAEFFRSCVERGIYFHTDFTVSGAHTKQDIDRTLNIMESILNEFKKKGLVPISK